MGAVRSKKVLLLWILLALGLAGILLVAGLSWRVATAAAGRVFSVFEVPATDVAIVFGARVWQGGRLTPKLEDRVLTAIDLYRSGKVKKLLMSGNNSRVQYDEPTAMRNYAIGRGVPAQDIVLDFAGFHAYDTCYRAQSVSHAAPPPRSPGRERPARARAGSVGCGRRDPIPGEHSPGAAPEETRHPDDHAEPAVHSTKCGRPGARHQAESLAQAPRGPRRPRVRQNGLASRRGSTWLAFCPKSWHSHVMICSPSAAWRSSELASPRFPRFADRRCGRRSSPLPPGQQHLAAVLLKDAAAVRGPPQTPPVRFTRFP